VIARRCLPMPQSQQSSNQARRGRRRPLPLDAFDHGHDPKNTPHLCEVLRAGPRYPAQRRVPQKLPASCQPLVQMLQHLYKLRVLRIEMAPRPQQVMQRQDALLSTILESDGGRVPAIAALLQGLVAWHWGNALLTAPVMLSAVANADALHTEACPSRFERQQGTYSRDTRVDEASLKVQETEHSQTCNIWTSPVVVHSNVCICRTTPKCRELLQSAVLSSPLSELVCPESVR
jgi:hypothetical protein